MTQDAVSTPYGSAPYGSTPAGGPRHAAQPAAHGSSQGAPTPPLAGWFRRVGANLLDALVDGAAYGVGGVVALMTAEPTVDALGRATTEPTPAGLAALLVGFLVTLGVTIWNRYLRQGRTGQSLGKSALGIRLVSLRTGAPVGAGLAFARDIAHVLDGILYIGYLWPLWDPMKQTFADKIVGSVVVGDA